MYYQIVISEWFFCFSVVADLITNPKNDNTKSGMQVRLFGGTMDSKAYIGRLWIGDAWLKNYSEQPWYKADIMTPHHKNYYGGDGYPHGMDDPVPIQISVLKPGLIFQFFIKGPEPERKFIKSVLKKALEEYGLGAKTAVGYGRFKVMETKTELLTRVREADGDRLKSIVHEFKSRKRGNDPDFDQAMAVALENNDISATLENAYKKYVPLRFLRLKIKDQIKGLTRKAFKSLVKNKEFKQSLSWYTGSNSLVSNPDGQFIFEYALKNFPMSREEILQDNLLKQLVYSWDDKDYTEDELYEIIEDDNWIWPPKKELKHSTRYSNFAQLLEP